MAQAKDNSDEIGELIKLEDDPKVRAQLIVLQNINLSLIANTQTVNDIDEQIKSIQKDFQSRAAREDEIFNKGRGAWKVASWVLGLVQTAVIALVCQAYVELIAIHTTDARHEARLSALEAIHSKELSQ